MSVPRFQSITAVLCTYNGGNRIINTLNQLASQVYRHSDIRFDLIVVDNASTDHTYDAITNFFTTIGSGLSYEILQEKSAGKGYALELGYNRASGDLILTVDDDNWLPNHYIQAVYDVFNALPDDAGLLGAYGIPLLNERPTPEIFLQNAASFACADFSEAHLQEDSGRKMGWAAGSVFPRKIWQHIYSRGFRFFNSKGSGKAYGEDSELFAIIRLLGYRQFVDKRCWFLHDLQRHQINEAAIENIRKLGGSAKVAAFLIDDLYYSRRSNLKTDSFEVVADRLMVQWKKNPGRITLYSLYTAIRKRRPLPSKAAISWHIQSRSESMSELQANLESYRAYYQTILNILNK